MAIQGRKDRERAERQQLIVTAARELAEAEGWEAVTTRKLAQRIEYSQPVLYSHFAGKEAIVAAVALEGFAELKQVLREARTGWPEPVAAADAVARAYLDFANANPALFDAMFTMPTGLAFGGDESPEVLVAAFGELVETFAPLARGRDVETFTELAWSAVHGQVVLGRGGRLRGKAQGVRMRLLVEALAGEPRTSV